MLKSDQVLVIHQAIKAMRAGTKAGLEQAADALLDVLQADAAQRAAVGASAAGRAGTGKAGKPPSSYVVELDPAWEQVVQGAKAAHDLVVETLAGIKGAGAPPTANSLAVQISRTGHWMRVLETDAGTQFLTVRKAPAKTEKTLGSDGKTETKV